MLKPGFVADNRRILDKLAARTRRCAAVVGFVDEDRDLYNAAAVCANGDVLGTYRKRLLPNYAVFDEARYFTPGTDNDPLELYVIGGVKVGISICEDIWSPFGPLATQSAGGAELSININGSPYHWRKGPGSRADDRDPGGRRVERDRVRQPGRRPGRVGVRRRIARVRRRGQPAGAGAPVRRAADDRRRADPARLSQAPARSTRAAYRGRAAVGARERCTADQRRVLGRRRRCRPTNPMAVPLEPDRELYDALVLGTRDYCAQERLQRRRDRAVGRDRLDARRLHRRRRPRPRARARRVDAVALLERPLQVRRPTARREPRHRLPDDLDRARLPGLPRHARRRRSPAASRASRTRTCRAAAAGSC